MKTDVTELQILRDHSDYLSVMRKLRYSLTKISWKIIYFKEIIKKLWIEQDLTFKLISKRSSQYTVGKKLISVT